MNGDRLKFASLPDAIAALRAIAEPMVLTRVDQNASGTVIIAVNEAAAARPAMPLVGEHPDSRRDRNVTADVELDYLYRHIVERGHAQQVVSIDGLLYELTATRVEIDDDPAIYALVAAKLRNPPAGAC
jgi:hypothetical protein